jgi:uncharacterized protein YciI
MVNDREKELTALLAPMLKKTLYVAFSKAIATSDEMLNFAADHLRYMNDLKDRGLPFASGPFIQENVVVGDGLTILNTSDEAEARRLMDNEPFAKRGMRSFELRKWELREGMIPIRLRLSRTIFDLEQREQ